MARSLLVAILSAAVFSFAPLRSFAADPAQQDIVETAVAAEFNTLVKSVQAAGLVDTLKGKGPFTVFAPTDKAFAAIPKDKLEALLKDKKALTALLTYHIVAGKVTAAEVIKLDAAKTVQGQKLKIETKDGKVRINDANVVTADIACANGVIHVIDAVLLPPRAAAAQLIEETLAKAGPPAQTDAYKASLRIAAAGVLKLVPDNALLRQLLAGSDAVAGAPRQETAAALHDGLLQAVRILRFEPKVEAEAPTGFPQPTPVGEIEVKSYPAYRLARTDVPHAAADDAAFFTLFRHITSNEIAMTAPVEMTYSPESDKHSGFRPQAMAFLYESARIGQIGKQGEVSVSDMPAMTVLSIGMSGDYSDTQLAHARALLMQWLQHHPDRYLPGGPLRVMGHNSPMVPVDKRYFEVQIPLRDSTDTR